MEYYITKKQNCLMSSKSRFKDQGQQDHSVARHPTENKRFNLFYEINNDWFFKKLSKIKYNVMYNWIFCFFKKHWIK